MLLGARWQKVVAHSRSDQEKTIPCLSERGDDELIAAHVNFNLADTLRQANIRWKAYCLGTVVQENSSDGHGLFPMKVHLAM